MTPPLWQQALVQWVRACLAPYDTPAPVHPATTPLAYTIPVILVDQRDAPRPANPNGGVEYVTIRVLSERSLGSIMRDDAWDAEAETLTTTHYDRREGTVSIGIYGPRAQTLADAVGLGVDDEDATTPLASADVALGAEVGRVTVGVASGSVPEAREVIDYRYRRTATLSRTTTGWLEHVALTLTPNGDPDAADVITLEAPQEAP